jgi:hypothetical protein
MLAIYSFSAGKKGGQQNTRADTNQYGRNKPQG